MPINRAPLTQAIVGRPAGSPGTGRWSTGTTTRSSTRRTVVDSLGAVDTVVVGDATRRSCVGDSGGPALVKMGGIDHAPAWTRTRTPRAARCPPTTAAQCLPRVHRPVRAASGRDGRRPGRGGPTRGAAGAAAGREGARARPRGAGRRARPPEGRAARQPEERRARGARRGRHGRRRDDLGGLCGDALQGGLRAIGVGGASGGETALAAVLLAFALRRRPRR